MSSTVEVAVALDKPTWREGAVGLLLPIPPSTPHQRLVEWQLPKGWVWQALRAENREQGAAWVTKADDLSAESRYWFAEVKNQPEPHHYQPYVNRFTALPEGLRAKVQELAGMQISEREKVQQLASYVASRFIYNPTPSTGAFPDVACDIKQGNCLDINTVFLSMLHGLGIRSSYDIGYYFKGSDKECDGWHCWVSLIADGEHQDWDIPHILKFNVTPFAEGLNPAPGRRVCMSRGRGSRFRAGAVEVEISHFCRPRWVMPDGTTQEAPMRGTMTQRS
jgi:hypothetical protein